jgi:hypothetical protein
VGVYGKRQGAENKKKKSDVLDKSVAEEFGEQGGGEVERKGWCG